jgi:hypothetical protein
LLVCLAVVSAGASLTDKVSGHLNFMTSVMDPTPTLVQLQATMMAKDDTINVVDEIATLLIKMQREIMAEQKAAKSNHTQTQNECDKRKTDQENVMDKNSQLETKHNATMRRIRPANYNAILKSIAGLVRQVDRLKVNIGRKENEIDARNVARGKAHRQFLLQLADFDSALEDVDGLRTLLMTMVINSTSLPNGLIQVDANKEFQSYTSDEINSLSNQQAHSAMKKIADDAKQRYAKNSKMSMFVSTVSNVVEVASNSPTDKIRTMLIAVRNELQTAKKNLIRDEDQAIADHKTWLIANTNLLFGMFQSWCQKYTKIMQKWEAYGREHLKFYRHMRAFWLAFGRRETTQITYDFEQDVCRKNHKDYIIASKKRNTQLDQIKKALDLLSKMSLTTGTKTKVLDSVKDITAGLCREYDDYSNWFTIAPSTLTLTRRVGPALPTHWEAAYNVYKNVAVRNGREHKYICVSQVKWQFTCSGRCDIRTTDTRFPNKRVPSGSKFPRIAYIGHRRDFGKRKTFITRLDPPMEWYNPKFQPNRQVRFYPTSRYTRAVKRNSVAIFVVPGCNCNQRRDKAYDVKNVTLPEVQEQDAEPKSEEEQEEE